MCVFPMAITRTREEPDAPDEYSSSVPQSLGGQRASLLSELSNPPISHIPDEEALSSCRLENQLAALASWQLAAFQVSNKITENKTKQNIALPPMRRQQRALVQWRLHGITRYV